MKTIYWTGVAKDIYGLIKEKFCAEFEVEDKEHEAGRVKFVENNKEVSPLPFVHFLKGFEAAVMCVSKKEMVFPEEAKKEKNDKLLKIMDELGMEYVIGRTVHPNNPGWSETKPIKDPYWICGIPFSIDIEEPGDIDYYDGAAYGSTPLEAAGNALERKQFNSDIKKILDE